MLIFVGFTCINFFIATRKIWARELKYRTDIKIQNVWAITLINFDPF